jgi:hypothetical protein
MIPPHKKSKKNTPAEAKQEDHHIAEDNGNSLTAEPSQISDQERREKLEALQKARAKITTYTMDAFAEEEAEEEDDEVVDRQLQTMNQKLLILQKERVIRESAGSKKKSFREIGEAQSGKRTTGKDTKGNL